MDYVIKDTFCILLMVAMVTGPGLYALSRAVEKFFNQRVAEKTKLRERHLEFMDKLISNFQALRLLSAQVCYRGSHYKESANDEAVFRTAIRDYQENARLQLSEIEALKLKSIALFPPLVHHEIDYLHDFIQSKVDMPITELMESSADPRRNCSAGFERLAVRFTDEVSPRIEKHIRRIAEIVREEAA